MQTERLALYENIIIITQKYYRDSFGQISNRNRKYKKVSPAEWNNMTLCQGGRNSGHPGPCSGWEVVTWDVLDSRFCVDFVMKLYVTNSIRCQAQGQLLSDLSSREEKCGSDVT